MDKVEKIYLNAAANNDQSRLKAALNGDLKDFWGDYLGRANLHAVDKHGRNAGMLAAQNSHQQIVLALLDRGLNMNETCRNGRTVLHYAVIGGNFDLVDALIKRKPDLLNRQDSHGLTPLHLAVFSKTSDAVIEHLINTGAGIDIASNNGDTALHLAVDWGRISTTQLLIKYNAALNKQNNLGHTPLHICFKSRSQESSSNYPSAQLSRILAEAGANPYISDNRGGHFAHVKNVVRCYEVWLAQKEGREIPPEEPSTMTKIIGSLKSVAKPTVSPKALPAPDLKGPPPPAADDEEKTPDPIRDAFINDGLDPDTDEQWRCLGNTVVEHVIGSTDQPRVLVATFNFSARQFSSVTRNMLTGQVSSLANPQNIDQMANPAYVEEAYQKLLNAGKTPPPLWPKDSPGSKTKKNLGQQI